MRGHERAEARQQLPAPGMRSARTVAASAVAAPAALSTVRAWPARPSGTRKPRATSSRSGLMMAFVSA